MIPTVRYGPVGRLFLDSSFHIKQKLLVLHLKYARSMEGLNSVKTFEELNSTESVVAVGGIEREGIFPELLLRFHDEGPLIQGRTMKLRNKYLFVLECCFKIT